MNEPMTLVDKLRNPQWGEQWDDDGPAVLDVAFTRRVMEEAADEIERLRANINLLEIQR